MMGSSGPGMMMGGAAEEEVYCQVVVEAAAWSMLA